jgi:hypothetical protein
MQCPEVVDVGSSRQSVTGRPLSPTLGEEMRNRLATVVIAKLRGYLCEKIVHGCPVQDITDASPGHNRGSQEITESSLIMVAWSRGHNGG